MDPIYERELLDSIAHGAVKELRLFRQGRTIVRVEVLLTWRPEPKVFQGARGEVRRFQSLDRLLATLEGKNTQAVPRVVIELGGGGDERPERN